MILTLPLVLALLQTAPPAASPTMRLIWDQPAPDLPTATSYTFTHYDDGSSTGIALTGVTCVAKTPPVTGIVECAAPFPAFSPGSHTITISASNLAGEGPKSSAFPFTFVVVPGTPTNLRIGK